MNSKHQFKTNILHDSTQNNLTLKNAVYLTSTSQKRSILQNNFLTPKNKTIQLKQHNRNIENIYLTECKENKASSICQPTNTKSKTSYKNIKYEDKIGQIDELLSKFKTKYAILREKYLILQNKKNQPIFSTKNQIYQKSNGFKHEFCKQTMCLKQNNSSKLTVSSDNALKEKLLKKTKLQVPQKSNSVNDRRCSQGLVLVEIFEKTKLCSTFSRTIEKQFLLPLQKIQKSNQIGHLSKFQFIKDVQSQDECDKNNLQESVVISKLSDMINSLTLSPK